MKLYLLKLQCRNTRNFRLIVSSQRRQPHLASNIKQKKRNRQIKENQANAMKKREQKSSNNNKKLQEEQISDEPTIQK